MEVSLSPLWAMSWLLVFILYYFEEIKNFIFWKIINWYASEAHEELIGELAVKVEGQGREKNRSKHSETEQRRRSKINERQALQAQSFTLSNSSTPLIVLCRFWFYIIRFSVLLELEKFLIRMPIVTMYLLEKLKVHILLNVKLKLWVVELKWFFFLLKNRNFMITKLFKMFDTL